MKKLSLSYPKTEEDERTVNSLVMKYKDYQEDKVKTEAREFSVPALSGNKSRNEASFGVQWEQLWYRTVVFTKREPQVVIARFSMNIFNGLLALSLWWQVNGDDAKDLQNMTGVLFIMITNTFMGSFFASLNVFQLERPVFLREQANQMYGFVPYFLTKQVIEQPCLIFALLVY